jgi:hypothetical protein
MPLGFCDMSTVNMLCTSTTCDLSIRQLIKRPDSEEQSSTPSQLLARPRNLAQKWPTWRASVLPSQIHHLFCSHQVVVLKVELRNVVAKHVLAQVVAQE